MTDFVGATVPDFEQIQQGVEYTGRVAAAFTNSRREPGEDRLVLDIGGLNPDYPDPIYDGAGSPPTPPAPTDYVGKLDIEVTPGANWFESFHVVPRRFDFGNLLAQASKAVEVYSAFRRDPHDWDSFVNNASPGVTLVGQPGLPYTFQPQTGLAMQVQADIAGPPSIDTTLDFVFDVPQTIMTPITIERVILFDVEPEMPYTETLEFLTEVLEHETLGTEQRISARKNPRQLFDWTFRLDDGVERSRIHNLLFEWQNRNFGVPVWHDQTVLTSAAVVGQTVLNVGDTDFGDFRGTDSLVVIFQDRTIFDVQPMASMTSTTVTLENPLANNHPAGTRVVPVRIGQIDGAVRGQRFITADGSARIRFRVTDNDNGIASTAAFDSFNSKVLINGCNSVSGNMSETFEHSPVLFDNEVGVPFLTQLLPNHRRSHALSLRAAGRQATWETRQLMHALRGRQVSFYVVTFSKDLVPNADLVSGQNTLSVENVGYSRFVQERQPNDVVRVVFNTGDPPLIRNVSSSIETDSTTEVLTLDATWASTWTPSQVRRVEFVQKVRYNTDRIQIRHERGERTVRFLGTVKAVLG